MGLDVYLYRYENYEDTKRREKRWDEEIERIYAKHPGDAGSEKLARDAAKEALGRSLEFVPDKYGDFCEPEARKRQIEIDSAKYPEQMFKIGYFRSSYNDGGINNYLRRLVGQDCTLEAIFGHEGEEYHHKPDWAASRERALEVLRRYDEARVATGNCDVWKFSPNIFGLEGVPADENAAMAIFLKQKAEQDKRDARGAHNPFDKNDKSNWYSMRDGHFFFGEVPKIRAVICGTDPVWSKPGRVLPATYVVVERSGGDAQGIDDFYRQALEIVVETCDWVLAQPDIDKYVMHWSG